MLQILIKPSHKLQIDKIMHKIDKTQLQVWQRYLY